MATDARMAINLVLTRKRVLKIVMEVFHINDGYKDVEWRKWVSGLRIENRVLVS